MRALHLSAILLALSLLIPVGCGGDKAPAEAPEAVAKAEAPKAKAAPAGAGGADCVAACANLSKLMMAALPPETPANVRDGAKKELASCPADCAKESNPAEIKCLISATSMDALQKCHGLK